MQPEPQPLRKTTYVGNARLELVSIDGGKCYVWPASLAATVHDAAQERRRAVFNPWPKKKKETGRR